jgi:hypothetical protein
MPFTRSESQAREGEEEGEGKEAGNRRRRRILAAGPLKSEKGSLSRVAGGRRSRRRRRGRKCQESIREYQCTCEDGIQQT